ncbi:GYD domain-containing protein [Halobiforma haloterrestris]|uniref:GYD domain-containing protein n=2 Tax=Natronobacterium haloterrestre TaxID=148448 RepID=A0A1I1LIP3_NATHA|nr:GYD domain-containing protein [Halobiforma haloterrestris]
MDSAVDEFYLTFGEYDAVAVIEAPDDETAAQLVLTVSRAGAISSETLKAFPEDEYREVIEGLPEQ